MENRPLNKGFWANKKVFLTGHTGFKGTWLALWLDHLGSEVVGFSLEPPTDPSLFDAVGLDKLIASEKGDVRDIQHLSRSIEGSQAPVVFHLAAQPLVRASYDTPLETYTTNVLGTANVLDASKRSGCVRVVVIVSSDKCYRNDGSGHPFREDDPLGGGDHYSASKAAAEHVVHAYLESGSTNGPAIASARGGNVIGGGDWGDDRLVPDLIRSIEGDTAWIRNPSAVRPWQHVLDCLHGYILLAESLWDDPKHQGAWNFGPSPGSEVPVLEVAERVARLWPEAIRWAIDEGEHPREASFLSLDATKARQALGWNPMLNVNQALEWTVEWYRRFAEEGEARPLTLEQVMRYASLLTEAAA